MQIEAVENHMPEILIVDEIGTEAEALACRTIAERGVVLIGTAHGCFLENLIKNPTLSGAGADDSQTPVILGTVGHHSAVIPTSTVHVEHDSNARRQDVMLLEDGPCWCSLVEAFTAAPTPQRSA